MVHMLFPDSYPGNVWKEGLKGVYFLATGGQAVKGNMEEWRDAELRYFQKKNFGLCGTCIFLYNQQMAAC